MNCFKCDIPKHKEVPLLVCGCYICPDCYCRLKSSTPKIQHCLVCNNKLVRSSRKQKIIKDKYILDMLYTT
jgi:hypothetical protein